jgi:uncharacterized protein YjcR
MKNKDIYLMEAESMYFRGKTLSEISKILTVSERTLLRWKKRHTWEEKKKKYILNPLSIERNVDSLIIKRLEKLSTSEEAESGKIIDQLSKLAKVKISFGKQGDFATQAIYVFEKFSIFIKNKETDIKFLEMLQEYIQKFIRKILKDEEKKR